MKKIATVVAALALVASNAAHAQNSNKKTGAGAQAGTYSTYDTFAWGLGLGALVVLGVVVGITVAGALGSQSSH